MNLKRAPTDSFYKLDTSTNKLKRKKLNNDCFLEHGIDSMVISPASESSSNSIISSSPSRDSKQTYKSPHSFRSLSLKPEELKNLEGKLGTSWIISDRTTGSFKDITGSKLSDPKLESLNKYDRFSRRRSIPSSLSVHRKNSRFQPKSKAFQKIQNALEQEHDPFGPEILSERAVTSNMRENDQDDFNGEVPNDVDMTSHSMKYLKKRQPIGPYVRKHSFTRPHTPYVGSGKDNLQFNRRGSASLRIRQMSVHSESSNEGESKAEEFETERYDLKVWRESETEDLY